MKIEKKLIKELVENLKEFNLTELEYQEGQTKISLIINNKNQKIHLDLQNTRKFDFNHLKAIKSKEYVKKITV